jgi:predicted nucleic acid-binding protein
VSYLLDTNVLLRWVQHAAPEHAMAVAAVTELRRQGEQVCITPQNVIEFWSVATRPTNVNGLAMSPARANQEMRDLETLFTFLPDIPAIYGEWRDLVTAVGVSGRQVHDARLVAVMRAHGITHLLTFNPTDIRRYRGTTVVHPQDVSAPPAPPAMGSTDVIAGETEP